MLLLPVTCILKNILHTAATTARDLYTEGCTAYCCCIPMVSETSCMSKDALHTTAARDLPARTGRVSKDVLYALPDARDRPSVEGRAAYCCC